LIASTARIGPRRLERVAHEAGEGVVGPHGKPSALDPPSVKRRKPFAAFTALNSW
jgi:hypothetical protein